MQTVYTMTRTSIIVSNLQKNDFIAEQGHTLSLASQIKLSILNLHSEDSSDFLHSIVHWSDLPFLNRVIIIFRTPAAASQAYKLLESGYNGTGMLKLPASVKLSLQENLLLRSKLSDALNESNELNVTSSLEKFRNYHNAESAKSGVSQVYEEPKPQPFNAYADLQRLGIDISEFNSEEQLDEMRASSESMLQTTSVRHLPVHGVSRTRSSTKTLFKPDLKVNTGAQHSQNEPKSPTITLDETF